MKEKILDFKDRIKLYFIKLIKDIKNINTDNIGEFIKLRIKLIVVIVMCIFMAVGYTVGRINNSKSLVLSKLERALSSGDASKLKKVVKVEGKKLDKSELEPLIKYYENDKNKVYSTMDNLKTSNETQEFILKSEDKLFGKKYSIDIKTYKLSIKSNFQDGKYTLDGKEYKNYGEEFQKVIPGIHNVNGYINSISGDITTTTQVLLMKDDTVQMDFDAIYVSVKSNYLEAKIYINGEDSGLKVKDNSELGPFKTDGSIKLHLENEFPWGNIKGEEVIVKDIPNINLSINMNNEIMEENIFENVKKFYQSVFDALNSEDKDKIVEATNETKDKIYDILEKKYILLKNKYTMKDINIVKDKNQYSYHDGKYMATIIVEMNYEISKSLFGINKTNNSKKFFTKLVYEENGWIIEDVENFNL